MGILIGRRARKFRCPPRNPAATNDSEPAVPARRIQKFHLSRLHLPRRRLSLRRKRSGPLPVPAGRRTRRRRGVPRRVQLVWRLMARGTHPGAPRGFLFIWPRWERIVHYLWPLSDIPQSPNKTLYMRLSHHRGRAVVLRDGTTVERGAIICELHCNNPVLLGIASTGKANPYHAAREDLRSLARWVAESGDGRKIRALYGFTLLGPAAARLGFTVRRCSAGVRRRFARMFMRGLLVIIYTPDGLSRLAKGRAVNSYPCEVWMSQRELLRRYGGKASDSSRDGENAGAGFSAGSGLRPAAKRGDSRPLPGILTEST